MVLAGLLELCETLWLILNGEVADECSILCDLYFLNSVNETLLLGLVQ